MGVNMTLLILIALAGVSAVSAVLWKRIHQLEDVVFEQDQAIDELWADVQEIGQYLSAPDIPPPPAETAH